MMLNRVTECPHCKATNREEFNLWTVDSTGYAYFAMEQGEEIDKKKWSSLKYAPSHVIDIYKRDGFKIVE